MLKTIRPVSVGALALLALLATASSAFAGESYIFSIPKIERIARDTVSLRGQPSAVLEQANQALFEAYPELVVPHDQGEWVFNAVGGSLQEMKILFCSPSEYLALWGAPVATSGYSGSYSKMDVWDIMLDGRMTSYLPGTHRGDVYANTQEAGVSGTAWLKRGQGRHFQLEAGTYMIDYGRGNLAASLLNGAIMGHLFVTGDTDSLGKILSQCAKQTTSNWTSSKRARAIERYRRANPDNLTLY